MPASIPGINRVESLELRHPCSGNYAEPIEPRIDDGARAVCETDQREKRARSPNLRIIAAGGLERWKRENDVADGSGTDQQPPHA